MVASDAAAPPGDGSVVTAAPECDSAAAVGGSATALSSGPSSPAAVMASAPLSALLNHTLLESDNTYAEAITRRLGADGSFAAGLQVRALGLYSPLHLAPLE